MLCLQITQVVTQIATDQHERLLIHQGAQQIKQASGLAASNDQGDQLEFPELMLQQGQLNLNSMFIEVCNFRAVGVVLSGQLVQDIPFQWNASQGGRKGFAVGGWQGYTLNGYPMGW